MSCRIKSCFYLFALLLYWTFSSCSDGRANRLPFSLDDVSALIDVAPDSAFGLLNQVKQEQLDDLSERERNCYYLLRAKAQNKAFVDFDDDSLMLALVSYYDKEGSANERVLANYLLGCVYRDLNEAPHAVNSFQKAVDCADTLSADCDIRLLSCVYSQMAYIFEKQMLWNEEIQYRKKSIKYSVLANDTLNALHDYCLLAGDYYQKDEPKKVEKMMLISKAMFDKIGAQREWLTHSILLIALYTEQLGEFEKAKPYIDEYEAKTIDVDEHGELIPSKKQFYSYKAHYYEYKNELDSSIYYYGKATHPDMSHSERELKYRGLLRVYQRMGESDSIAKYATLYCKANDSTVTLTDRELTMKMASLYDYNRFVQKASEEQHKAREAASSLRLVILLSVFLAAIAGAIILYLHRNRKRRQRELEEAMEGYTAVCRKLEKSKREHADLERYYKLLSATLQAELVETEDCSAEQGKKRERMQSGIDVLDELQHMEAEKYDSRQGALQVELEQLLRSRRIREINDRSSAFLNSPKVKFFRAVVSDPRLCVSEDDWDKVIKVSEQFFPVFLHDLHANPNISVQAVKVAVLILMKLHTGEMANLLCVNKQRISNIKSEMNKTLFGDSSARTLLNNLMKKYKLLL